MLILKISRSAYRRLSATELHAYARNVLKCTKGNTAYPTLQELVAELEPPVQEFGDILIAARNKGLAEVAAKNEAQQNLIKLLDNIVAELEKTGPSSRKMIIHAGFSVQEPEGRFSGNVLPSPQIVSVLSEGKKGELRMVLVDAFPRAVRTHAIEYSLDQGKTWGNITYNTGNRFTLNNLPRTDEIWIRVKSLGSGRKESEWSEPVRIAVY